MSGENEVQTILEWVLETAEEPTIDYLEAVERLGTIEHVMRRELSVDGQADDIVLCPDCHASMMYLSRHDDGVALHECPHCGRVARVYDDLTFMMNTPDTADDEREALREHIEALLKRYGAEEDA